MQPDYEHGRGERILRKTILSDEFQYHRQPSSGCLIYGDSLVRDGRKDGGIFSSIYYFPCNIRYRTDSESEYQS